ncbi:hypothetical protein SBADM41S_03290 [Streptomyces badius]
MRVPAGPCRCGRGVRGEGDVAGLRSDGVEAAEDDVLDGRRVDARAGDQLAQHMGAEVGGVDGPEASSAPSDGGAYRFDDVGLAMAAAPHADSRDG